MGQGPILAQCTVPPPVHFANGVIIVSLFHPYFKGQEEYKIQWKRGDCRWNYSLHGLCKGATEGPVPPLPLKVYQSSLYVISFSAYPCGNVICYSHIRKLK